MSDKVIWLEGMVLSPFYYGLASLEIDRDALDNGFLSLRECSGIFPDGTHFHYPRQDSQLEQRPFESHFSAQKETLGVYLAVPALGAGSANLSLSGADSRPTRFVGQAREVQDANTGGGAKEVVFGRLNLRILFEGEAA